MTYNPFTLTGKTILVTGASSGIGRATAIECTRMGARVCITGRDAARLDETFRSLEGEGHIQLTADLTVEEQIVGMVKQLPLLDGIVHSAGITRFMLAKHIGLDDIREVFDTNLNSVILLNRELLNTRRLNKGVSFVFISSVMHGTNFHPGYTLYSAAKGALLPVSDVLALELSAIKGRSNIVSPGAVETPMVEAFEDYLDTDSARYQLGHGKPEDVAWMCVYLLSDAARWVTRSEFTIHGGLV